MVSYRLVMRSGPATGKEFPLEKAEVFVGRDLSCEVVINDPEVSRKHARLTLQGDTYVIVDEGSTNGTFINGQRLMGPHVLRPGELITFGEKINLVFESTQPTPEATVVGSSAGQPVPPPVRPVSPPPVQHQRPVTPPPPPVQPKKKSNAAIWIIVIVLVLLLILCSCIGLLWYIDANKMWCSLFGPVFNMFAAGTCP